MISLLEQTILPTILLIFTSLILSIICFIIVSSIFKKSDKQSNDLLTSNENNNNQQLERPLHVPKHIAVIMDGNRRYGKMRHSDPLQGHWAGGQKLIDVVQWCMEDGVEILTVYAFSTENWNRDPIEIAALMNIFIKHSINLKAESLARNIKVKILSTDWNKLPFLVQESLKDLEKSTENCTSFVINVCVSYGGRSEILNACKSIVDDIQSNALSIDEINENEFSKRLLSSGQLDPDILIRTSGEFRLSNFLLWQMAYTEMFFISKYWPEITQQDLREVMHRYSERNRRYGI